MVEGSHYFEDFFVGETHETPPFEVSRAEIVEFAARYDPQPMHVEGPDVIASGWQTAALTMRQFVTSVRFRPPPGALGLGVTELKWLKPVHPGDWLRVRIEVLELRKSDSRPGHGIATYLFLTINQLGEPVQKITSSMLLPCKAGR